MNQILPFLEGKVRVCADIFEKELSTLLGYKFIGNEPFWLLKSYGFDCSFVNATLSIVQKVSELVDRKSIIEVKTSNDLIHTKLVLPEGVGCIDLELNRTI